jgi:hypothetical protein
VIVAVAMPRALLGVPPANSATASSNRPVRRLLRPHRPPGHSSWQ